MEIRIKQRLELQRERDEQIEFKRIRDIEVKQEEEKFRQQVRKKRRIIYYKVLFIFFFRSS
jgi:hypothetical protein